MRDLPYRRSFKWRIIFFFRELTIDSVIKVQLLLIRVVEYYQTKFSASHLGEIMSKIAINNEIVLMRQAVRQSRVRVVKKLIKEAKLLGARKHGDEKIREKCKRKADRLVAEIGAVKKIKDDEITKFGIVETRNLQEILSDLKSEPSTRVMARLGYHKILNDRISKFKAKFPNYEEHLGPGRKKLSKLQRKANRDARNGIRENREITERSERVEDEIRTEDSGEDENDDIEDANESGDVKIDENTGLNETNDQLTENISIEDDREAGDILRIKKLKSTSEKRKAGAQFVPEAKERSPKRGKPEKLKKSEPEAKERSSKRGEPEKLKKSEPNPKMPVETKKSISIRLISKEATVKRFADLIGDGESSEIVEQPEISVNPRKKDLKIEKQIDSFFMTENGESDYMSVVVPRSKLCEEREEEEDDRFGQNHAAKRRKNFHDRNNKFFSKIDRLGDNDYGNKFASRNNYSDGAERMEKPSRAGKDFMRKTRNVDVDSAKKNDTKEEEELHPSWAARKKQQEILKQGFQGKKIVFDD